MHTRQPSTAAVLDPLGSPVQLCPHRGYGWEDVAGRQQALSTPQGVHLCVSHPLQSGPAWAHGFCCISHVCPVEQRNRIRLVRRMFPGARARRAKPQLLLFTTLQEPNHEFLGQPLQRGVQLIRLEEGQSGGRFGGW